MAIGTITVGTRGGHAASRPMFADTMTFDGDDDYPAGGTASFQAAARAALGANVTVLAVIPNDCGGYIPVYDQANDKLKVYEAAADGNPLDEVTATTDLSTTSFNVVVLAT